MAKLPSPVRGCVYSLRDIFTKLDLLDSPHLGVTINDKQSVVQNSHLTDEDLLSIPGFAETEWRYKRTTNEWIPIFEYVGQKPITEFVDFEDAIEFDGAKDWLWVTPKGFPREQYYKTQNGG